MYITFLVSQSKLPSIFKEKFEPVLVTCRDVHMYGHTLHRGFRQGWHPIVSGQSVFDDDAASMSRMFLALRYTALGGSAKMVLRRSLCIKILWCFRSTSETRGTDAE